MLKSRAFFRASASVHLAAACSLLIASGLAGCAGEGLPPPTLALPPLSDAAETAPGAAGGAAPPQGAVPAEGGAPALAKSGPAAGALPNPQAQAPLPTGDGNTIVGFRGSTVILYNSQTGNDGQRVPAGSMPLPLLAKSASANRLEVSTADGPKWISRAEVRTSGP